VSAEARAILSLARWAPSGDNTQPWRFELASARHVVVHGFDTRSHCVYDLDGRSSQLALGALLESIRIAASGERLLADITRRADAPEPQPVFDVRLMLAAGGTPSPLLPYVQTRCVQRRALSTRMLTSSEKKALEASVGSGYRVAWLEGLSNRWRAARLLWANAGLRLTLPEAFETHRSIIEWNARYSEDRIPERALGANRASTRLMRFALEGSWSRVEFMNRWLAGTVLPRVELDLVPALACGAHFLVWAESRLSTIDDYLAGGAVLQRFWLTATQLGLHLQPAMTPLIFSRYAGEGRRFSRLPHALPNATTIAAGLAELFGPQPALNAVFMGRIGAGLAPKARSLRLPLERLIV
jgi:hypothetical protein